MTNPTLDFQHSFITNELNASTTSQTTKSKHLGVSNKH